MLIAAAGYGHECTVEESTLDELRRQFDGNVFGTVAAIKAVLPHMRQRRKGRIITVTYLGADSSPRPRSASTTAASSPWRASPALAAEVARFGIHVTAVEPGAFRTDWSGRSTQRATRSIPDYDQVADPISAARAGFSGQQRGDPDKAGAALLRLIELAELPTHLLLGSDAYGAVTSAPSAHATGLTTGMLVWD